MNMPTHEYQRLLIRLLAMTLIVSALFAAFPQLDIYTAAVFYQDGFWMNEVPALQFIRMALIWGMTGFALFLLLLFVLALVRRRPVRALGYALAVILTGPLFLVNSVLKNNWGRARPEDIMVFGGDKIFTPAYFYTDQCDTNCSFTSGEGGAIATVAILIAFFAWPKLGKTGRRRLLAGLGALVLFGAGLRVAMGQHFLSDTLLSILFCALVAAVFYRVFYPDNRRSA